MSEYVVSVHALADDLLVAVRDFPLERPFSMDPARGDAERLLCEAYNRLYCELHDKPSPCTCTLACEPRGLTEEQACRERANGSGHTSPARAGWRAGGGDAT